jgi:nucleotide-binding universal stress UspA family protein
MRIFKKLMVPVDFSPESKRALRYGLALASEVNGEVIALHVIEDAPKNESLLTLAFPPETWPFSDIKQPPRPLDTLLKERALDLWNFLDGAITKPVPIAVRRLVRSGTLREEIIAVARQENIDVIVLELRKKFFFPNRARRRLLKMIDQLPYPVLLPPPHTEDTPSRGKPVRLFEPWFAVNPAQALMR